MVNPSPRTGGEIPDLYTVHIHWHADGHIRTPWPVHVGGESVYIMTAVSLRARQLVHCTNRAAVAYRGVVGRDNVEDFHWASAKPANERWGAPHASTQ